MIKLWFLLLPFLSFGQFYKYSTIYGGGSFNSTAQPIENYEYTNNELIETTNSSGSNYRYQLGIKKISRHKFEKKSKFYYDGKEQNASIYRSPVGKFEYLAQYEKVKDRGLEFENYDFWLRYVGDNYSAKIQQSINGYVDLQYKALDFRLKRDFKDFRATFGIVLRNYPIYHINAFKNDFPNYNNFNSTIKDFGFSSSSSWIDGNMNGYFDRWEQSTTIWINETGDTVANSTQQMQEIYADIVSSYNKDWTDEKGNQNTLSNVIGLSYYKHFHNFFVLIYANYFLYNHAMTEYATTSNDYDFGMIGNVKLNKSLSLYSQLNYLKYFNRENYTINFGINYIII